MDESLAAFLAGERPAEVAIYLASAVVDDPDALAAYGETVPDGVVMVVPGERGRRAFAAATGSEAMAFARRAMGTEGQVDGDLTGGTCPQATAGSDGDDDAHEVRVVFAFAEEQNEGVGGIYAEGDVIHAYARCSCGEYYSDRWVADRDEGGS